MRPWDCVQSSEEEDLFAEGLAAVSEEEDLFAEGLAAVSEEEDLFGEEAVAVSEPEAGFAFSDDSRSSVEARAAPFAALDERLSVL